MNSLWKAGDHYFDRLGDYEVLGINEGMVTYRYDDGRVATHELRAKEQIYNNILSERKAAEAKAASAAVRKAPRPHTAYQPMAPELEKLSVVEAREILRLAVDEDDSDTHCFLCHERARHDKKSLNRFQAEAISLFYEHTKGDTSVTFYAATVVAGTNASRSNDLALLRHWGLIVPTTRPEDAPLGQKGSRGMSGFYQLTPLGVQFAEGKVAVPKTITHQWGTPPDNWGFQLGCPDITIEQALASRLKSQGGMILDGTTIDDGE